MYFPLFLPDHSKLTRRSVNYLQKQEKIFLVNRLPQECRIGREVRYCEMCIFVCFYAPLKRKQFSLKIAWRWIYETHLIFVLNKLNNFLPFFRAVLCFENGWRKILKLPLLQNRALSRDNYTVSSVKALFVKSIVFSKILLGNETFFGKKWKHAERSFSQRNPRGSLKMTLAAISNFILSAGSCRHNLWFKINNEKHVMADGHWQLLKLTHSEVCHCMVSVSEVKV